MNNVIYAGVSSTEEPHLRRRVLFANVIYLSLIAVYTFFIILDIESYLQSPLKWNFDNLTVPIMALYCFIGIELNKKGYSFLGRILFLILWPLLMHILPVIILNTPSDYYLAFPLGIIFHSVLIQLLISYKREPLPYYVLMTVSLLFIIYSKDFLLYHAESDTIPKKIVSNEYFQLVAILYWLLFNTMTFYVMLIIENLVDKTEFQRIQLMEKNHDLEQMNDHIDKVNRRLEEKVNERTSELVKANKTLTEYAYYNAHTIKGPYCRIEGITMLYNRGAIDENDYHKLLKECLHELHEAINDMQNRLNDSDIRTEDDNQ